MAYGYGRKYGSTARRYNRRASARGRGLYTGGRYGGRGGYAEIKAGVRRAAGAARSAAASLARDSAVRSAGGQLLKAVGTHAINRAFGNGSYTAPGMPGTVSNELIAGGHASEGIMRFDAQRDHETLVLSHSEYVMDVYAPPEGQRAVDILMSLNPGERNTFPMLSQIAANFETYRLKQCIITYKPLLSSWLTENGQVGQVVIASQYNTQKQKWTTKEQMLAQTGSTSSRVIEGVAHGVECDVKKLPTDGKFFVRTGMPEGGVTQLHEYDHAFTQIRVQDVPTVGTNSAANVTLGEIHISYTVELSKPRMWSGIGNSIPRALYIDGRAATSAAHVDTLGDLAFQLAHTGSTSGITGVGDVELGDADAHVGSIPAHVVGMRAPAPDSFRRNLLALERSSLPCLFGIEARPVQRNAMTLLPGLSMGQALADETFKFLQSDASTAVPHEIQVDNINVDWFALTLPANYAADLEVELSIPYYAENNKFSRAWIGYQYEGNVGDINDMPRQFNRQFVSSTEMYGGHSGGALSAMIQGDVDDYPPATFTDNVMTASEHSMAMGELATKSQPELFPNPNPDGHHRPLQVGMLWQKIKLHLRCQRASAGRDNKVYFKLFRIVGTGSEDNAAGAALHAKLVYGRVMCDVHQYNSHVNRFSDGTDDRPVLVNELQQVVQF